LKLRWSAISPSALSPISVPATRALFRPGGHRQTTLAMHVARKLGQPAMLLFGDDEFGSSNLIGGEHGYRSRKVVDRFIPRLKTEEDVSTRWVDNRLTQACREGFTLIYDEFNRSARGQ